MPLIVLSGLPSSGKTTRAKQLEDFFRSKGKKVNIVSEEQCIKNAKFEKNDYYSASKNEKQVRADIKSNVIRLIQPNEVLILDGSNYIKGYRYELYCCSKEYKTTQCTVYCDLPIEHAWQWNEQRPEEDRYSREIFDALVQRYEAPDGDKRWDSPLYTVYPEDDLPLEEIYSSLIDKKPPKQNMSTQSEISSAQQLGVDSNIKISKYNVIVESAGTIRQLNNLRKQFVTFSKQQPQKIDNIPGLFVQYLNKSL
ncbi:unnamed protein product [Trichogramma brassicae]|uniref:Protein KTI12 homolog n=1 Tax=Trichogramma brassicae TaxID=86971 RepID=A0A6H5IPU2_9HYME|nr:unnamed protein product [Trichogramma brassicae]